MGNSLAGCQEYNPAFLRQHGRIVHGFVLYLSSYRFISERGEEMLQNNIEMDMKMRLIESGLTQTEVAEKVGVTLSYVNRITKGREQIVNKTFIKIMDELGYDVELTYKKKSAD
jgi:predicted XRE-type DNA-binding protein